MIQGDAGSLIYGWNRNFFKAPWTFLLLSFGPPLIFAVLGVVEVARRNTRALVAIAVAISVCAAVLVYVEVPGHLNSYVPFRTGQIFLMMLAILLAFAFDAMRRWPAILRMVLGLLFLAGSVAALPTLAMDEYNARDIDNRARGPGFPWTVLITPDDVAALGWLQAHVAADARVQIEPTVRDRASWALIPAFGRRHMAIGAPLFLPNPARYKPGIERVKTIYGTADADLAYNLCRELGIDYLYVGGLERAVHPDGVNKFISDSRFELVFQNATVEIFRVGDAPASR
jgi:uncharacterized membrane protein